MYYNLESPVKSTKYWLEQILALEDKDKDPTFKDKNLKSVLKDKDKD